MNISSTFFGFTILPPCEFTDMCLQHCVNRAVIDEVQDTAHYNLSLENVPRDISCDRNRKVESGNRQPPIPVCERSQGRILAYCPATGVIAVDESAHINPRLRKIFIKLGKREPCSCYSRTAGFHFAAAILGHFAKRLGSGPKMELG